MPKVKDKDILRAQRERQLSTGNSDKAISWFLNRNTSGQYGLAWNIQSDEKQGPTTKTTLSSKAMI